MGNREWVGVNPQPIYDDHPTPKIAEGYAIVGVNFPPFYDDHHTLKIIESFARVGVEPRSFYDDHPAQILFLQVGWVTNQATMTEHLKAMSRLPTSEKLVNELESRHSPGYRPRVGLRHNTMHRIHKALSLAREWEWMSNHAL